MANNEQARQVVPVTEEEVFAACDALLAAGQKVTRRAVLGAVGRGSMTTIARMLAVWEERQRLKAEANDIELTQEEAEQVLALGRQLLRSLTDRVRTEAVGREQDLSELVERERLRAAELAVDYDELSAEMATGLEARDVDITRLTAELAQARAEIADAAVSVGEARGRADILAGDLAATKATLEKVAAAREAAEREGAMLAAAATLAEERARAASEIAAERARSIAALEARVAAMTAA